MRPDEVVLPRKLSVILTYIHSAFEWCEKFAWGVTCAHGLCLTKHLLTKRT